MLFSCSPTRYASSAVPPPPPPPCLPFSIPLIPSRTPTLSPPPPRNYSLGCRQKLPVAFLSRPPPPYPLFSVRCFLCAGTRLPRLHQRASHSFFPHWFCERPPVDHLPEYTLHPQMYKIAPLPLCSCCVARSSPSGPFSGLRIRPVSGVQLASPTFCLAVHSSLLSPVGSPGVSWASFYGSPHRFFFCDSVISFQSHLPLDHFPPFGYL